MKKTYRIADLLIKITGFDDLYFEKRAKHYYCPFIKKADIIIRTSKTDNFIENKYDEVRMIGESQYFFEDDNHDTVIFYDEKMCRIVALIQFNKSYDDVSVTVCNLKKLCGINQDRLLFNVLGIAMQYIIRMKNGLVIHSSAISSYGKGIAFSAQSGVGKSTHTAMWLENIPGTVMINDDTPIIRTDGKGGVYLYGSPWAGATGLNSNMKVPLDAVVFLGRSSENSIKMLSAYEAMDKFFDAIRPPLNKNMHINTLDTVDLIMRKSRMYHLKCNTDIDAVNTVRNEIIK